MILYIEEAYVSKIGVKILISYIYNALSEVLDTPIEFIDAYEKMGFKLTLYDLHEIYKRDV